MTVETVLVTGAAKRIGSTITRHFHSLGYRVVLHCNSSVKSAQQLVSELNGVRPGSATYFSADLSDVDSVNQLAKEVLAACSDVDVLINNASSFYPTPVGKTTEADWNNLFGSNLKGPFFLSQALAPALKKKKGCIINIVDVYAQRPLRQHTTYCMAKAGLAMMTKSLALELAPDVRVNGVAPGSILWPEQNESLMHEKAQLAKLVPLQRMGEPSDIAEIAAFLARKDSYISGQVIAVDGGRSLNI